MNDQHDLDALLMKRRKPAPPHDLAERIVQRAVRTPQRPVPIFSLATWGDMLSLFVIPRPALAMSFCLVMGLFGGWVITPVTPAAEIDSDSYLSLVMVEEEWL